MLTIGATSLATWEVENLRQVLAPVIAFSRRYHRHPYSLSTLPTEIGAHIKPFRDDDLEVPALLVDRPDKRVIRVNGSIIDTPLKPVAVVHECTHHIMGHDRRTCTEKMHNRRERDVWLASSLVAVSSDLTRLILIGHATVPEIAARCYVPESLVWIRVELATVLDGRRRRMIGQAIESIRYWLGQLEQWIELVKTTIMCRAFSA